MKEFTYQDRNDGDDDECASFRFQFDLHRLICALVEPAFHR